MVPEVVIDGTEETQRSLRTIAEHLEGPQGGWGTVETIILNAARGLAPKRTGRLAASGQGTGSALKAAVAFGGAQVPYANPIHWGWAAHNIKPQPFLSRAVDRTEAVWLATYEARTKAMIQREEG